MPTHEPQAGHDEDRRSSRYGSEEPRAPHREGDDDILARDELLLATLAAASLCSRVVMGPARANAGGCWATASSPTARSQRGIYKFLRATGIDKQL